MNNDQTPQPNGLDSLIGDNHLQMMKAALPYMNVPQQRFISLYVKMNELNRTISLFHDGEVASMGICSAGEAPPSTTPMDMLGAIKPFASPMEQDFIDLISNFFQGFRLAGSFAETAPPTTMAHGPITEAAEAGGHEQSHEQGQRRGNANPFGRLSFDQLKNFMPPEQQSKLETMQMMMSAMQQMT